MIEVRRLRILQELDAQGTVAGAARALHLTPSAVSQQLAVLAKEAGAELLERDGRRVRLTGAGHVLLAHAHAVIAQLEAARSDLAAHAEGRIGLERAGGFPSAIRHLLAPAAAALRETHPGWRTEISEVETEVALPLLAQGDLDLIVVMSSSRLPRHEDPRVRLVELLTDPFDAALPSCHPLARGHAGPPGVPPSPAAPAPDAMTRDELDLAALAEDDWVVSGPGTACREVLEAACRGSGFQPRIAHCATDFNAVLALVGCGLGVTLVPRMIGAGDAPGVCVRPLRGPSVPSRRLYAALRRGTGSTPLLAALQRQAARLGRSPGSPAGPETGAAVSPRAARGVRRGSRVRGRSR
ncbi:LysR family transcriptional regulator [Sphaerisporangium perillae]|uniref:LysR family transcriptional regulator n=1 Tax=Sphaerisporangium perillae TaxID=2935860 RepID=UPI00200F3864|nr:LysR family transcriptional regulator [Sphaerisporangium perillae]